MDATKPGRDLDGFERPEGVQERLDYLVERVLTGQDGDQLMAYLKSITINHVYGPEVTDGALRHHEGARALVGVLQARIQRAEQRRKAQAKE